MNSTMKRRINQNRNCAVGKQNRNNNVRVEMGRMTPEIKRFLENPTCKRVISVHSPLDELNERKSPNKRERDGIRMIDPEIILKKRNDKLKRKLHSRKMSLIDKLTLKDEMEKTNGIVYIEPNDPIEINENDSNCNDNINTEHSCESLYTIDENSLDMYYVDQDNMDDNSNVVDIEEINEEDEMNDFAIVNVDDEFFDDMNVVDEKDLSF